ncbi:Pleckstrin homology domain-containing family F member 2 [Acropora cervicornis]|uniref:Pleckstrin homology domain-containing family F member 2 n=1 Tax=Acropora cervicornis TaxID=6130 RepID=A0AAD9V9S6_ACRCE|nr:Pleckstrin homology domain-containing family F member 2 [Acropora cervicornis]
MEVKGNEEKLERPLPFRSVHGLIESPVRFINLTGRRVDVIWINYQGQEVLKASLSRRDNRLDCNTFMTHPWIAVDPKTNERMLLNFKETYFPSQPEIKGMDFQRRKAYALRTQVKITLPVYSLEEYCIKALRRIEAAFCELVNKVSTVEYRGFISAVISVLANTEANERRIRNVENCFGASGQPLMISGRVLVGEGVLTKLCRKKPKPRQFFLFNDILVYGNIVINKKKDIKLQSLDDEGNLKNGWQIISAKKSFAVYAATRTEKAEWMAHINKCIQDLLAKTGKRGTTEHAAVWVPDSEASTCMNCLKSKFTALNRRVRFYEIVQNMENVLVQQHHCRKCGGVVCSNCSTKKCLLPSQSSKPLRVCDRCYNLLATVKVTTDQGQKKQKTVPTQPQKVKKPEEDSTSGEENSEDDDLPTFYQGERKIGNDDRTGEAMEV